MIIHSPDTKRHDPSHEFNGQKIRPYPEVPARVRNIIQACQEEGLTIQQASSFESSWIEQIHDLSYIDFIKSIPDDLDPVASTAFNTGGSVTADSSLYAKLGHYFFDPATPVMGGTNAAAVSSVNCALTVAALLQEESLAAGLCRPPGHHAMHDRGGGYCIFNNIAIATQYLSHHGKQVSIIDLDFHHGNGTQSIFYNRDDVQYVSIHAEPTSNYPFYWGYSSETGDGDGLGFTHNLPVSNFISADNYLNQLDEVITIVDEYDPDVVLVSMGFDCHIDDPIAGLTLETHHYTSIGQQLSNFDRLGIILEGGYAVDKIGPAFVNLYQGLRQ